jgi:hypothetical protein
MYIKKGRSKCIKEEWEIADHIERILNEVKKESPNNIFIDFIMSLKDNNFGVNEKPEFFKNKYQNIVDFYKENGELDDKD